MFDLMSAILGAYYASPSPSYTYYTNSSPSYGAAATSAEAYGEAKEKERILGLLKEFKRDADLNGFHEANSWFGAFIDLLEGKTEEPVEEDINESV